MTTQPMTAAADSRASRGWLWRLVHRRHFVVDAPFQSSLVGHMLGVQVLFLVVLTAGLFAPLLDDIGRQSGAQLSDASIVLMFLHDRFWFVLAAAFLLTSLLVLRLSHRIAGPLVRFKRHLASLGEGVAPPPLVTRRGDYLGPEVALLNATIAALAQKGAAAQSTHDRLVQALVTAADACSGMDFAVQQSLQDAIAAAQALQPQLLFSGSPSSAPVRVMPSLCLLEGASR